MAIILYIDTALDHGGVCLSQDNHLLAAKSNTIWQQHAAFLQPAIQEIFKETGLQFGDLNAIAVSNGPGSYTGLRVGLASAKGLCYALDKPLILLNTLEIMAASFAQQYAIQQSLLCPMIDARRMEVYTALYNANLQIIIPPDAMILSANFMQEQLSKDSIYFFGSGSSKLLEFLPTANDYIIENFHYATADMIPLAIQQYSKKQFDSVAYSEPFYIKPFFTKMNITK